MNGTRQVVWDPVVGVSPYGRHKFSQLPGVYVFAQADVRGAHVRYVGQASNLNERIYAHLGGHGNNGCLQIVLINPFNVRIRTTVQRNERARADLEHTYYMHYSRRGQLCNAREPTGRYLEGVALPF